jgi:uncharacterized damage-inducible protein DinB
MGPRDFFLERRRAEHPVFLRVLDAIPESQADYRPHERSPSALQIVWTLTNELRSCLDAATQLRAERLTDAMPTLREMRAQFEQLSNQLNDAVDHMDDSSWNRTAEFYSQGRLVSEQPVGQFLWFILFDAIHHRGQLSTYLRPMGATVPAIYGPSADSRSAESAKKPTL